MCSRKTLTKSFITYIYLLIIIITYYDFCFLYYYSCTRGGIRQKRFPFTSATINSVFLKKYKKNLSFFIYILAQKYKTNIETINNRITISLLFISFFKKRILLVVLKIYVFVGAFVVQFYTSNRSLV